MVRRGGREGRHLEDGEAGLDGALEEGGVPAPVRRDLWSGGRSLEGLDAWMEWRGPPPFGFANVDHDERVE